MQHTRRFCPFPFPRSILFSFPISKVVARDKASESLDLDRLRDVWSSHYDCQSVVSRWGLYFLWKTLPILIFVFLLVVISLRLYSLSSLVVSVLTNAPLSIYLCYFPDKMEITRRPRLYSSKSSLCKDNFLITSTHPIFPQRLFFLFSVSFSFYYHIPNKLHFSSLK